MRIHSTGAGVAETAAAEGGVIGRAIRAAFVAVGRAKIHIGSVAVAYALSVALERRDAIVGGAQSARGPSGPTWLGLPRDRVGDAALAYVVIAPLFLVASLWEFLAR